MLKARDTDRVTDSRLSATDFHLVLIITSARAGQSQPRRNLLIPYILIATIVSTQRVFLVPFYHNREGFTYLSHKMATMNDLPAEVLRRVFHHLTERHCPRYPSAPLMIVAAVSTSWHINAFETYRNKRCSCCPIYTRKRVKGERNGMVKHIARCYLTGRDGVEQSKDTWWLPDVWIKVVDLMWGRDVLGLLRVKF